MEAVNNRKMSFYGPFYLMINTEMHQKVSLTHIKTHPLAHAHPLTHTHAHPFVRLERENERERERDWQQIVASLSLFQSCLLSLSQHHQSRLFHLSATLTLMSFFLSFPRIDLLHLSSAKLIQ